MKSKTIYIVVCVALAIFGCQETVERGDGILMTGTDSDNLVKFAIDEQDSYAISVTSTTCVGKDIKVNVELNPDLLSDYNKKMGTKYILPPRDSYKLTNNEVVIPTGQSVSTSVSLEIVDKDEFVSGASYVIPVSITHADTDLEILESGRTIFLKLSRTVNFKSLYVGTTSMSKTFSIDNAVTGMTQYTWEVKFKADNFNKYSVGEPIRVCGCMGNMLRFGEAGAPGNILEVYDYGDKMVAKTEFSTNTWYLLSIVNDGKTVTLYVNGKKDNTMNVSPHEASLDALEIGMSTKGYESKQLFRGWLGGIRVWSRALSGREINAGLCGVSPDSPGLEAYWPMNEGTGTTLFDISSNQRNLVYSLKALTWEGEEKNKCVE